MSVNFWGWDSIVPLPSLVIRIELSHYRDYLRVILLRFVLRLAFFCFLVLRWSLANTAAVPKSAAAGRAPVATEESKP
jgi:hypothetical protein